MRPLSLAFVTSLPNWGGGEKWFLDAARAMDVRGHRVVVVGQPESEIRRRADGFGLATEPIPMHGILDPRTLWSMGRCLRRHRVDVAITNQAREIRLVGLSQLGRRGFRLVARRGSPDPVKDNWHFRLVYRHLVDRLIFNCEALVPRVLDGAPWFDREKVELLYNGIDPDALRSRADASLARRSLGIDARTRVVSMVGEVGWRKDQATFLRAIQRWKEVATFRDVVFLIAGEGPERALLEQSARSMGLPEDQVRFLGFRRDVPDLLALSDLVVLPSREEGFPNTLLEAMALGRAVIATPVDGIVELIEDGITGRLVGVGDATSLARVIAQLLENDPQRLGLGSAAAARVERDFDQENMMDRFEQILRDTTASGH